MVDTMKPRVASPAVAFVASAAVALHRPDPLHELRCRSRRTHLPSWKTLAAIHLALALLASTSLASAGLRLQNGDFRSQTDGKPLGWHLTGSARLIADGGRSGLPAIELECPGDGTSSAVQEIRLDPPRKGGFVVTAWMRCDQLGEAGDCSLWLDVLQKGGPPIWGAQGLPDRASRQWQQVRAEIRPTHPVTLAQVYLILRNVKGRVRFCDVRVEDIPVEITELRAYRAGSITEVRASISESVSWEITVMQQGVELPPMAGEGCRIVCRCMTPDPGPGPVTVALATRLNGVKTKKAVTAYGSHVAPDLDVWLADSFTRVFQDDLPPEQPTFSGLNVARGESEAFQLCLRPPLKSLANVRISSQFPVPNSKLSWSRVGYVWVEEPFAHPFSPRRTTCWWPDPLLPPRSFSVDRGKVQPLWFTLTIPKDTKPGRYSLKVTVKADDLDTFTIALPVTVHRAQVPVQGRMKTAFALMDGHLEKLYGKITPKLRRAYTDFLLAHRLNPDDISRTTLPDLDELQYANSRGLNAFNILNVVPERKAGELWVCFAPVDAYTPEFKKRFLERLDAYIPELEKRGLIDKAYIYGFDERGPDYIPIIRDLFAEIKRRYPRLHTCSTCWPPAGTDPSSLSIDWYVPLSASYDHKLAAQFRKKGGEMWWYVCLGPRYPYANWLLEHPLIEARLLWWQAFSYDVEGFLYWGLNIWERKNNDKPIPNDAGPRIDWSVTTGGDYNWLNGDGVLLYPGADGPIGSIRLENIRDGLEDIELLRQYRDRFDPDSTRRIIERVTTDRVHYSREPVDLLSARLTVLKAL